jgi:hypothetical protein
LIVFILLLEVEESGIFGVLVILPFIRCVLTKHLLSEQSSITMSAGHSAFFLIMRMSPTWRIGAKEQLSFLPNLLKFNLNYLYITVLHFFADVILGILIL